MRMLRRAISLSSLMNRMISDADERQKRNQ
jgi:hypothetical protein